MPPKQSVELLLALAGDPVLGWTRTPVASRAANGCLSGPYLAAFFRHHVMPVTRKEMENASGARLLAGKLEDIPVEHRDANDVAADGLVALAQAFNHGFTAPEAAQANFLAFLRALPDARFGVATAQLQKHYELCRAFRAAPAELASPPTHLDLFKDERVSKRWRLRADGASTY